MHLDVARELLEAGFNLTVDFGRRQRDIETPLELTGLFQCCCHVISYTES